MKKILFLLLFFLIKLSAFEYLIAEYMPSNPAPNKSIQILYIDKNENLMIKRIYPNGSVNYGLFNTDNNRFIQLSRIKFQDQPIYKYVNNETFQNYYKNDLLFLDLLYKSGDAFLNYLYNDNSFTISNYIKYGNYELLYNEDGQVIESVINGKWAGLYDDSQKSKSGAMYNKNGSMVYYNGKEVTPVTSFLVWLQKFTNKVVIETFEEIQRSLVSGIIAAVVLVLAIVRLVLELLPSSITPRRRRYYGGGRGTLPDYGDGSQVAASVRARLAAKNRALKARAYDRSGVEQSLQNSILFDLENER